MAIKDSCPDYQTLFESVPGMYLILLPDFTICTASDAYLEATKTSREAIQGRCAFEVFRENPVDTAATGAKNLRASLERVLKYKEADVMPTQKYDIKLPDSQGGAFEEKYWNVINSPVLDKAENIKFIINRVEDVTEFVKLKQTGIEQHKVAEELRLRTNKLESIRQSQRMEAMGQLAGGVAHDFNNVLSIILINCELMLESPDITDSLRTRCEQIQITSERAADLIRQLLAFSRKQVLQPQVIDVNNVVNDLEILLQRLITNNIQLKTKLLAETSTTKVDPGQVEQILLNLVVNARDSISGAGNIEIETANVVLDYSTAAGNPRAEPGHYVMIAVRDSGCGMNAATQARLFEPFFTTKAIGKGTGLGLATVFGIVAQNKGTIWVYSEIGKGSVFKIYLPVAHSQATYVSRQEPAPPLLGNEKILVVEDQDALRRPTCEVLRRHGYIVSETDDGQKALAVIKEKPEAFDLIITDVIMPEMCGRALAKKLSQLNIKSKVLYLSGYTEDALIDPGQPHARPHFLEKPYSAKELLNKVREVLGTQNTAHDLK